MPPIFCIISLGRSRGKTRLIEWMTSQLSSLGIMIATIKHSRESIDLRGKDTYRHLEAGAIETCYISPGEIVTIRRVKGSIEDAIASLHVKPDLILVEGFKNAPYPKILCANTLNEVKEALEKIPNIVGVFGENLPASAHELKIMDREEILSIVRDAVVEYWVSQIPGFNCGRCRYGSCKLLAEAIKRGEATIRDCVMKDLQIARIMVDDREIPLGPWPQKLLRSILKAFIGSLKDGEAVLENARRIFVKVNLEDGGGEG